MSSIQPEKKSNVSLSATTYRRGIGLKPIMNYEATPLSNGDYVISKPDGSAITVSAGDTIPSVGKVAVDANGNLSVGEFTVPTGLMLSKQYTAIPLNKEKTDYALLDKTGTIKEKYTLGTQTKRGALVQLDEFGNLKFGDQSVKVLPILLKINFKVLSKIEPAEAKKLGLFNASRAVFNVSDGQDLTSSNGVFGYFIPRGKFTKGKRLGEFKELYEGELVTTAEMYPANGNSNIVSFRVRTPEVAYKSKFLFQEKFDIDNILQGVNDQSKLNAVIGQGNLGLDPDLVNELATRRTAIEHELKELGKQWDYSEVYMLHEGVSFINKLNPAARSNERSYSNSPS